MTSTSSYIHAHYLDHGGIRKGADVGPYEVPVRTARKVDGMTAAALKGVHHLGPFILARPDRTGICMANRLGGWGFGEPEMTRLHRRRYARLVNVYLGTASFPAAPQGEISIAHGYLGHSKTFMGDGDAFYEALDYAHLILQLGVVDQVLVGAVESVTSPWLLKQLGTSPLPAAACFLLLGREPGPTRLVRMSTEPRGQSAAADSAPTGAMDTYAVDAAARFIGRLEEALSGAPCEIIHPLPREPRQVVFRVG